MNALKVGRVKKGYNQDDLATIMNVSRTTVSNWEQHRTVPTVSQIMQLHLKLEIPLDILVMYFNNKK